MTSHLDSSRVPVCKLSDVQRRAREIKLVHSHRFSVHKGTARTKRRNEQRRGAKSARRVAQQCEAKVAYQPKRHTKDSSSHGPETMSKAVSEPTSAPVAVVTKGAPLFDMSSAPEPDAEGYSFDFNDITPFD
jgi:hypothetical protein